MRRTRDSSPQRRVSTARADRVGTAEFRRNLAKYLGQARAGRPVTIVARSGDAFVLVRADVDAPRSIVGCMRDRTSYLSGSVVGATEPWSGGEMP